MMKHSTLRQKAACCRRAARSATDPDTAKALDELADDFERAAFDGIGPADSAPAETQRNRPQANSRGRTEQKADWASHCVASRAAQHWRARCSMENLVPVYRICFVDRTNQVFDVVQIDEDTDEAAIREAYRLDVRTVGIGFDIRHEDRLVYRHRRN
jgi:hypothetical protein